MGNREKLLEAAKQCLFEKGYGQTTVRDISSTAGVSMAAIGYHFGSKEDLMTAAIIDALGSDDAFETSSEGATPLRQLWTALLESFADNKTFWIANLEAVLQSQRDPKLRETLLYGIRQGRSGMTHVLTGEPEDSLPDSKIRTLGSVQMALISGLMMQRLVDPENAPNADEVMTGIKELADLV